MTISYFSTITFWEKQCPKIKSPKNTWRMWKFSEDQLTIFLTSLSFHHPKACLTLLLISKWMNISSRPKVKREPKFSLMQMKKTVIWEKISSDKGKMTTLSKQIRRLIHLLRKKQSINTMRRKRRSSQSFAIGFSIAIDQLEPLITKSQSLILAINCSRVRRRLEARRITMN